MTKTSLSGQIAHVLQRIVLNDEQFEFPVLPPVVGGTWGDVELDDLWGPLHVDGAELIWELQTKHGASTEIESRLRLDSLRNAPAHLLLADGTRVRATFGYCAGQRVGMPPGFTCKFILWQVEGRASVRWVGKLVGGGYHNRNLSVETANRGSLHMRLVGNYTWYLLDHLKDGEGLTVVIDSGPSPLDHDALATEFLALQVAFGAPMQLDALVGLDDPGNIVGCAGVHLGGNRKTRYRGRADGPVPDILGEACWIPVLFNRLTKAMVSNDLPWKVACNAYLDSVSDSTIDGKYLKLHVALESFAKALLKKEEVTKVAPRRLVRDVAAWVAWVKMHEKELEAFVAEGANPEVFVNKVISAMNLPSSGVVADALSRLTPPLVVDAAVLDEVGKRNVPAHHFTMNKPGVDYDVDRDVERVEILRSLLVSLLARACGYDGAIAGWVTGSSVGWKPQPGWWPPPSAQTAHEASEAFRCATVE